MYNSKILIIIETYKNSFTKSEEKIVEYLKNNLLAIIYMSITELAEAINVGETTIIRFCKKIGFKGFHEFKISLAQDNIEVTENQGSISLSDKIYDNIIEVLRNSKKLIDQQKVVDAVTLMNKSRKVYFIGTGSSGISALEAKSKFFRIEHKFDAILDPHFQSMIAEMVTNEDVLVVLSISGSTKDIISVALRAKSNGAKIIGITNYQRSPIAKLSDVLLLTSGKKIYIEGGAIVEKIAQLYILDVLFMKYLELSQKYKDARHRSAKSVADKKY